MVEEIRKARKDVLDAENDDKKLELEADIDRLLISLEAQTRGEKWTLAKISRFIFFLMPTGLYYCKLVVYDKILGLGVTDGLGAFETNVTSVVLAFYFVTSLKNT